MLLKTIVFAIGILLMLNMFAIAQKHVENADLHSLVAAEREFSKAAVEIGVNDSFLKFFAVDGVNFQPQPIVISQGTKDDPSKTEPRKIIFSWAPIYADIAQSGELGYTTGPYQIAENTAERKVLRNGFYFSVWQKQADKSWKVLLDMGIGTPLLAPAEQKLVFAPQTKFQVNKTKLNSANDEINQLEQNFSKLSETKAVEAYGKFAREDLRLHRVRTFPILGSAEALKFVADKEAKSSWKNIKAGVSKSADFAWTYGTYKIIQDSQVEDKTKEGYYLRVWRRDGGGNWKIVAEITNPLKL